MSSKKKSIDLVTLLIIIVLTTIGTIMVFSASSPNDLAQSNDAFYTLKKQLIWVALSFIVMMVIALKVDYKKLEVLTKPALIFSIVLLGVVLVVGKEVNGAKRWLNIGSMGIQPSELAKLAIIMYFASKLSKEKFTLKRAKGFLNILVRYLPMVLIIGALIMKEPNMSTACIIVMIAFSMLLVAGMGLDIVAIATVVGGAAGAFFIMSKTYRMNRILAVMDPWRDASGKGYQGIHSLFAVGSGGLFGRGLGQSREKLGYLPMPHTDFIFSVTCEELGFVGALFIIILFVILIYRMIGIAVYAENRYACYLATGITAWIAMQAILHMLIAVSFFPVTGVPLPFISYGGSSTLFIMAAMGIVLNISKESKLK